MKFNRILFLFSHFLWTIAYINKLKSERKQARNESSDIRPMIPKHGDDGDEEREDAEFFIEFSIATIVNMVAILGYTWLRSVGL